MAILTPNFSGVGGNIQNPLTTIGNTLLQQAQQQREFNQRQEQQAADIALRKEANQRAADQLQMQKDEVARQQSARAASSQYLTSLGQALDKGVVSLADQGKLVAISQDARLTPEQRQQQIDALLPAMSNSYQKDIGAQLQLLKNVTVPTALDARDQIALLSAATDPLEKRLGRDTEHEYRLDELAQQNRNQLALEQMRRANEKDLVDLRSKAAIDLARQTEQFRQDKERIYDPSNPSVSVRYGDATPEQKKSWYTADALDRAFTAGKFSREMNQKLDDAISTKISASGNSRKVMAKIKELESLGVPKYEIASLVKASETGLDRWYNITDWGRPDIDTTLLDKAITAKRTGTYIPITSSTQMFDDNTTDRSSLISGFSTQPIK